jgi:hypothetical protein
MLNESIHSKNSFLTEMWSRPRTALEAACTTRATWNDGPFEAARQPTRLGQPTYRPPENFWGNKRGNLAVRRKWLITWQGWMKKGRVENGITWSWSKDIREATARADADNNISFPCFDEDKLAQAPKYPGRRSWVQGCKAPTCA